MTVPGCVPLVHVIRGSTVESAHYGAVAVVDAAGRLLHAAGDPAAVTFMRSSAKPFQIIPVLESGAADRFGLEPSEVAVAIGSHNGQDIHVRAVRSILAKAGLSEEKLMCGPHEPFDVETARLLREQGRQPTSIHSNCSGKHAAMLALAAHRGYPTDGYFHPEHPVQVEMLSAIAAFTGLPASGIALASDGCTVPTFGLPVHAAAAAYARLMDPSSFDAPRREAARRAVEAMRGYPEMVGGDGVIDTDLMRSAGAEMVAKRGAEGFYGIGFRLGGKAYGAAFKIADGDMGRARNAVALEIVRQWELVPAHRLRELAERYSPPILNRRGGAAGRVESHFRIS